MKKKIVVTTAVSAAVVICSVLLSVSLFNVRNPFSSCVGMLQILLTDKEYAEIQSTPNRVILGKTADTSNKSGKQFLDEYMRERGFEFIPDEQMGAMLVYGNGSEKEHVLFSENRYYSKWEWQ